jgi:hypothetical protein
MRFFLEETSFELPLNLEPAVLEQHLEALVKLVRARHDEGDDVFRWSKLLEEVEVRPGTLLCDLVYQQIEQLPVDRDLRLTLQQVFNRCVQWDDRLDPVPDPRVEIDGAACVAPTVSVVHSLLSSEHGAACLSLGVRADRSGVRPVRAGETTHNIHFLTHDAELPIFYRTLFEIEDLDPDAYMENAARAFPAIVFAPGLASQFSKFQTPYPDIRPDVTKHLAVLNDHFQRVHRERKDKTSEAIGEYGIDASLERGKTHKNKDAMKQRTVVIDGHPVVCEWHTKIKRHTDRIHFDPGDPNVAGGRLIVGLFKDHFDL